ncbi:beta-phosphoglucomutase family hydrolase [Cryobacterium psychrophilum]|uniref:Beta-phosphoglucomutase family hydrolase n=1 Tax=Cryobacterium psychrophilum TaxID=41988 RepID=A0A4Y8KSJ1_9MICO|nr:beta-phosphoglucomutase family hydrolase [Cryobacterium psychrophilum]TDW28876.1 HAD superfamily hydrolase (TIGR01509 family)/beta-phosphoglucomutase family hydrolase [Cryobacterium psychrophilum]TFD81069.1 beta-phosphoglucomutase family hydrolase [Cryobacterium psychrophilum]
MRLDHLWPAPGHADGGTASGFAAVIFDMDGVVTDTAGVHAAAWKALFDQTLPRINDALSPFDAERDYRAFVDGRPREDGVRTFLASRGITLPEGSAGDGPEQLTVHGLATRKQGILATELAGGGVKVFADAVELLQALAAVQVPVALVTSSRNSAAILDAAGIADLFPVRVDGTDAVRLALPGKPDPAMFWEAARRLQVAPADAAVIEDAAAGVRAAASGRFGLVVGVDRTDTGARLAAAGADVVVRDLAGLRPKLLGPTGDAGASWCGGAKAGTPEAWNLVYDQFDPVQEGTREALCTLGNGYWATRGSVPGSTADGVHYPGTYLAGIYNRLSTDLDGRTVETEDLVNAPDWAFLTVRAADGPVLRAGTAEMLSHHQDLDLRRGVLTRTNSYRDSAGRSTRVTSRQFQSLAEPHLAAVEVTIEAEDWSGEVIVESAVNGAVSNSNVAADSALAHEHLVPSDITVPDGDTVIYEADTSQSGIRIATAIRTHTGGDVTGLRLIREKARAGHEITLRLACGIPVRIEKTAAVATSKDRAVSTAGLDAGHRIDRAPGFAVLLAAHERAWGELWARFGIRLQAGSRQSLALNLHIFHVLQTVAFASPDLDAGLPARGLHGEGYRGHVFWDELFVYPVLTLRRPELTRASLLYRYRRLDAARAAARAEGLAGAMFPWQSGSDGREETPDELFNPRNQMWMPDNSRRQRHVGLAVAYSVWQYYQATADTGFLVDYGAEILVEVARLFTSMAVHDPTDDRYDISGVMGPDEYHDGYPDAVGKGVRNNAYTNVLAAWVLSRAAETVQLLVGHDCDPLRRRLGLEPEEAARWERISQRLRISFHADGVISQFEGYEQLEEFDWDAYRTRYGNIGRLDLILQAEGDTTNRYKLSKQADVLMLFYLFSAEELRDIFARLGYTLSPDLIPTTVGYYLARTSHGSTLSRLTHSWVLARTDRRQSWALFEQALEADLADTQGGTTREGIHLGAMAGTADMVIRCYAGVETRQDTLWIHPVLPAALTGATFQLSYRGQPVSISLTHDRVSLRLHPCSAGPISVCVEGTRKTLQPGQFWDVPLQSAPARTLHSSPVSGGTSIVGTTP